MSTKAAQTVATTNEEDYTNTIDDYENENDAQNPNEAEEAEDSLAAMKKRVAAIEAEAAKISAMTAVDDDDITNSKSLTPNATTNATNGNNSNEQIKSTSSNASESIEKKTETKSETSKTITEVSVPKESSNEEQWPSTIEEQEELDARSVFIKNVDHNTDANELKAHFESCGTIERITIVCDKWTGKPKGCAYIQFKSAESVAAACLLNDKEFNGRIIKVAEKRTNLPPWLRFRGRGGYRGRRGRGYRGGYRGRGWGGYGGYRGRGGWGGGGYGGYGGYGGGYPY